MKTFKELYENITSKCRSFHVPENCSYDHERRKEWIHNKTEKMNMQDIYDYFIKEINKRDRVINEMKTCVSCKHYDRGNCKFNINNKCSYSNRVKWEYFDRLS